MRKLEVVGKQNRFSALAVAPGSWIPTSDGTVIATLPASVQRCRFVVTGMMCYR